LAGVVVSFVTGFAVIVWWPVPAPPPPPAAADFAIQSVTIMDTDGEADLADATVIVRDGKISAVGPAREVPVPPGMAVVDGNARYLIPGLWDMHAHVWKHAEQLQLPLYVAHGVTGVRDMLSWPDETEVGARTIEDKRALRDRVDRGEVVGPRLMAIASLAVDGASPRFAGLAPMFSVRTPAEARALVAHEAGRGADFIKMYNHLPRDAYFALMTEARARGLPVAGHRPYSVTLREAAAAGQRSIEHGRDFLYECFPGAAEFRAAMQANEPRHPWMKAMVEGHDAGACDDLFAVLAASGTWLTPTHVIRREDALADDPAYRNDPDARYIHALYRFFWRSDLEDTVAEDPSPTGRQAYRDFYAKGLELTGRAHAAGVKVLAGTDHPISGLSLHQELEELVKAGLTPREALRAATYDAAVFLGREATHGSVRPGRVADLVLLDADPRRAIANTRRIALVSVAGRRYDRAALDGLLRYTDDSADSWALGGKIVWAVARGL
jgi:imidazolonepropionase-like amidohydrolase